MNLPNKLTLLRIFLIPVFVAFFYLKNVLGNYTFLIACGVFALAAFTDFLDGKIARKYNMVTDFGKFLDPIADKVLVSTALIIFLVPPKGVYLLPWFASIFVAIILARELIISGFRLVAAGKGMVISADKAGKIKTFFTDLSIIFILISAFIMPTGEGVLYWISTGLLGISTLLTIISGVECMVKNKKVISSK